MNGIDTSVFNYQNNKGIGWQYVKAAGYDLTMNRATDGVGITTDGLNNSVDNMFMVANQEAEGAGLIGGAYHVLEPTQDISQQADVFLNTIGTATRPVAVDVEPDWEVKVPNVSEAIGMIEQFRSLVTASLHRPVMRYCDLARADWLGITPEWMAEYNDGSAPSKPCLLWQHAQGMVNGVSTVVDLDIWLSDLLTLHTWSGELMNNVTKVNKPPVAIMSSLTGMGYAIVCSDGGVFCFGDFVFQGSAGGIKLVEPIVDACLTPTGKGYWLAAADGGVFTYGDAVFYGSMGGKPLAQPIIRINPSPSGKGYRLLANDGGVFDFGDSQYFGRVSL